MKIHILSHWKKILIAVGMIYAFVGTGHPLHADPLVTGDYPAELVAVKDGNPSFPGDSEPAYDWTEFIWFKSENNSDSFNLYLYQLEDDYLMGSPERTLHSGDFIRLHVPPCNNEEEEIDWNYSVDKILGGYQINPNPPYPLDCILPKESIYELFLGQAGIDEVLVGREDVPDNTGELRLRIPDNTELLMYVEGQGVSPFTSWSNSDGEGFRTTDRKDLLVYFGTTLPPTVPDDSDNPDVSIGPNTIPQPEEPVGDGPDIGIDDGDLGMPSVDVPDPETDDGATDPDLDDKDITPLGVSGGVDLGAFQVSGGSCSLTSTASGFSLDGLAWILAAAWFAFKKIRPLWRS